jgi:hypothetical protein
MRTWAKFLLTTIIAFALAAPALPASAGTAVTRTGACSGPSTWKLKLSRDNGVIEVEFEVDSNVVGQTWRVRIFENGSRIFAGRRTTKAPDADFHVRRTANNTPGTDFFRARAVNLTTGETCVAKASI